ncbi:uncharacterized protein LOC125944138 [Dermacentor silvarum]|uniref:uncharacterized protein LOC125944138 n=1 Tax=Dermacentor silvarum TaxID=543639 RepID=UPI0021008E73|nr:uncharacterized protein LOC125944138 [Dermacentor silvarum]
MDEASYRTTMFYSAMFISTVVFLVKGGILYAFYKIYENYDQVVANEEARTSGTRPGLLANSAPVAIEQGNQLMVPAMPTGQAFTAPPLGGFQPATPGWWGVPSTTPAWSGMPQAPGQPYYVAVQQPHLPGQQQLAPSTQPQCFSSGGIMYVPYYCGTQPQLTVDQPAIVQGATAEATAAEATEPPPDKTTTPEAPSSEPGNPTRADSNQEPQVEGKCANAALSENKVRKAPASQSSTPTQAPRTPPTMDQDTWPHKVATAKAAPADSVYITNAADQETLPRHKPRRFSPRPSKVAESAPKSDPSGPDPTDA